MAFEEDAKVAYLVEAYQNATQTISHIILAGFKATTI